jgi:hypothetical protein
MTSHRRPPPPDRLAPWHLTLSWVTGLLFVGSVVAIAYPPRPAVGVTGARGAAEPTTVTVATSYGTEGAALATSAPLSASQVVRVPVLATNSQRLTAAPTTTAAQTTTAPTVTTTAATTTQRPARLPRQRRTTAPATTTETTEPTLPVPTDVLPTGLPVETTSEEMP